MIKISCYLRRWVSNVNLKKLAHFHEQHNKLITVTAVRPP